jgi:lysyl-tRNA synthetase class 2
VLQAVRRFFESENFLEVDTPVVIPAPAPEAHIDPQPAGGGFLQPSPELCMKRLLAAGYRRIFQVCKCFRRGERGRRHLPEFTLLEWYFTPGSYVEMMAQTEALVRAAAGGAGCGGKLSLRGRTIDLRGAWPRLTVARAFERYGSLAVDAALACGRFDEIMGLEIEPRLGWDEPVFLIDYPAACGSLARLKAADFSLCERFELYIGGVELCNAFSELTDPAEQRRRFEAESARRRRSGRPATPMPEPFLKALALMPPSAGNALGVDRLVMLLADAEEIDAVVAFTPEEL